MQTIKNKYTIALGIALIANFLLSLIPVVVLWDPLLKGDIAGTMLSMSQHSFQAHLAIFLCIVEVVIVAWLGVLLWGLLRKVNPVWAMTAMVFYLLEMVMFAIGTFSGYALVHLSSIHATSPGEQLEIIGAVFLKLNGYAESMAMIPFGIGGFLFYYLLYKSKALPSWIPIWGFLSVILPFIVVPLSTYGVGIPFFIVFPYVPFELFLGVYILIKGLSSKSVIWQ